jgi:hypothetical protein
VLSAVIDKYRQPIHVQRASLMSATLTGIRLRTLRVGAQDFAAIQSLTTALVLTLTRPQQAAMLNGAGAACDRRLLWRFGVSGDRPILLVSVRAPQGLGLLRSLAQALRLWSWGGIDCDLVVVNAEPASYAMPLQRELAALCERHGADAAAQGGASTTGFTVLQAHDISADELSTLRCLARVQMQADGRPMLLHTREWIALHEEAFERRHDVSAAVRCGSAHRRCRRGPLRRDGDSSRSAAAAPQLDQRDAADSLSSGPVAATPGWQCRQTNYRLVEHRSPTPLRSGCCCRIFAAAAPGARRPLPWAARAKSRSSTV